MENLQLENELLKLKLQTENKDAQIHIAPGLDPEMENKWLNYVYNYEKVCKEAPKRSVYEMLNKPDFKKADELSDIDIEPALDGLLAIMSKSKIRLDWLDDCYRARTLYQFITEELFNEIVDDVDIDGLMHMFTYEEFYPNHEYDMTHHTETFLECVLSGHDWSKFNPVFIADEILSSSGELLSTDELIGVIQKAQQENQSTKMVDLKIDKVGFDDLTGRVEFTLKYLTSTYAEPKVTSGHLCFANSYGFYEINEVYIPGIVVA